MKALMGELRIVVHDLYQPLSALQCRLYLGRMDTDLESMGAAIEESLAECERIVDQVRLLQNKLKS